MPIWNLAEPVMEALVEQVKESCSAAVLDGTDIVYVLRVPTRKIMSIALGVGSRLPAYCTSMGRVLLAGLPDDEVLQPPARLARWRRCTRHTVTDVDALLAKVQQARRQGWCLVNQELEEGLVSIAAPDHEPRRPHGRGAEHQRPGQPHQRPGRCRKRCCRRCWRQRSRSRGCWGKLSGDNPAPERSSA